MNSPPILETSGICPTCGEHTAFRSNEHWLRDNYVCMSCGSIPRERALMAVLEMFFPDWRSRVIHESSPARRGASLRLAKECPAYVPSHFFSNRPLASVVEGIRCENLESLTFPDDSIDIHVTQDVMEHIFFPSRAFREIARTLRPGGAHVFTTPLVNKERRSVLRARRSEGGEIINLHPPVYHGNPISAEGSLVTVDWGYDICEHIFAACGLFTHLIYMDDVSRGIRAEYIEVLVTRKPADNAADGMIP